MGSSAEAAWLPYYKPLASPALRLFAFHWAGGSASAYNGVAWKKELPEGVELLAVQLPGREKRKGEATPATAQDAAKKAVRGLRRFFQSADVPTAVFAHSMGTWVGFEFIRELRRQDLVLPKLFIVSNLAAPQTEESDRPWRRNNTLSEEEFKQECRAWGVNEIVMKDNFWKDYHLPFRADFTIFDQYQYRDEEPLETAILAFLSERDPRITPALMKPWAVQTRHAADFTLRRFQGDHFYVQDRKIVFEIVREVGAAVRRVLAGKLPSAAEAAVGETFVGVDEGVVRRINLIEILQDDYPDVPEPPEDCAERWTEQQIKAYFEEHA